MMIYRRHTERNAKWLIAVILFIAVMTFTVDQVFGSPIPPRPGGNTSNSQGNSNLSSRHHSNNGGNQPNDYGDHQNPPDPAPDAVPEPTTLILFGLGLAAAGAVRRKAKQ